MRASSKIRVLGLATFLLVMPLIGCFLQAKRRAPDCNHGNVPIMECCRDIDGSQTTAVTQTSRRNDGVDVQCIGIVCYPGLPLLQPLPVTPSLFSEANHDPPQHLLQSLSVLRI
jgi:hypothetical protein